VRNDGFEGTTLTVSNGTFWKNAFINSLFFIFKF